MCLAAVFPEESLNGRSPPIRSLEEKGYFQSLTSKVDGKCQLSSGRDHPIPGFPHPQTFLGDCVILPHICTIFLDGQAHSTRVFLLLSRKQSEKGGGHFQASFGRGPGAALGAPHHVVQHVGPPVGHVQGDQLHAAALSGALVHTEWRPGGARGGG